MRPSPGRRLGLALFVVTGIVCFTALGTWQVHRLAWKRALLQQIADRVHAAPQPAPGPDLWPDVSAGKDQYRHIVIHGQLLTDRLARVRAVTRLGEGYWILVPMMTDRRFVVLVNAGFVPQSLPPASLTGLLPVGQNLTITGLLRITEPGGALLRRNQPTLDLWFSRDVAAIAAARQLAQVAPYFVDADANPEAPAGTLPVGGLTVTDLPNHHLQYAITWYCLALMLAASGGHVLLRDSGRGAKPRG